MKYTLSVAVLFATIAGGVSGQCSVESGILADTNPGLADWFGEHVAMDGVTAAVGIRLDDNANGNLGGAVRVYSYNGAAWVFDQELLSPDGHYAEGFGSDVAISGDWLAVAARYHTIEMNPGQHFKAGAVYLFRQDAGIWNFEQMLLAPDHQPGDEFGAAIDMNGSRLIIGTPYPDDFAGAGYIYELEADVWNYSQRIVHADRSPLDNFGTDVAIDGDTAAIGSNWTESVANRSVGAVYVFDRGDDGVWTESQRLAASDRAFADALGWQVEIQNDEIVATTINDDDQGLDTGAAYVFIRTADTWSQTDKLVPEGMGEYALFGDSLSISGDMMLIGASGGGLGMAPARAVLFEKQVASWTVVETLQGSVSSPSDWYGHSVSISGHNAIVGDFLHDTSSFAAGIAYVYDLSACSLTCPADTNNDGTLTPADFFAWVAAFGNGDPAADINQNGVVDGSDFFAWVSAFGEGC